MVFGRALRDGLLGKARALFHGLGPKGEYPSREECDHEAWKRAWNADCIKCWERLSREISPGSLRAMSRRMICCPDCGGKRCPKATDHTLDCTGSNEPGQAGSAYQ
jgi:hypothetical protein